MPDATKIAKARELLAQLSPEDRAALQEMVRVRTQGPSNTPRSILAAAHLGGKQPTGLAREEFERGEVAGALAVPEVATYAAGVPAAARGVAGLVAKRGGAGALSHIAKRTAAGAAIGGVLGETPLPFVGGRGFKEGAILGAHIGAGQGGAGALWKHSKKKKLLEWLLRKAMGETAEAAPRATRAGGRVATKAAAEATARAGRSVKATTPGRGSFVKMEPRKAGEKFDGPRVAAKLQPRADKEWLEFVRREGKNFKLNERVWFVKDKSGRPVGKPFDTPEKAHGWIRRKENRGKGYKTDFFQNLWP
jgi:hypothetical protein